MTKTGVVGVHCALPSKPPADSASGSSAAAALAAGTTAPLDATTLAKELAFEPGVAALSTLKVVFEVIAFDRVLKLDGARPVASPAR